MFMSFQGQNLACLRNGCAREQTKIKSHFYMKNYLTLKIQILFSWVKSTSVYIRELSTFDNDNLQESFKAVLTSLMNQPTIVLTIKIFCY